MAQPLMVAAGVAMLALSGPSGSAQARTTPRVDARHRSRVVQTWWHDCSERQAVRPVAPEAVRQSVTYEANVTSMAAMPAGGWERSFVYQTIPRSGAGKRGYTDPDGAEYATNAGLSMSWTTFLYGADVWVAITQLDAAGSPRGRRPSTVVSATDLPELAAAHDAATNVTLRPRRTAAALQTQWLSDLTVAVRIPYRAGGVRVSVEFSDGLFDTYNDGSSCCNLTDQAGPGHAFVHQQPRHAMLVFAEPMLTAAEAPRLDPESDPAVNGAGGRPGGSE